MALNKMHKETGRMLKEDNTYINRADYVYNSHVDYYKKVLNFGIESSKGNVPGHTVIHKFGRNSAISSTFAPITESSFYRTPTSNTALEVVSNDANDTSTGTGARSITYEGLQESGGNLVVVTNTVSLNGTTAVALPDSLIRLYRWFVASSGTYGTQTAGSHQGNLTIQESGGGDVWSKIENNGFPRAQSQIGAYTVPTGYAGALQISFGRAQSQIGCYTVPTGYTAFISEIVYSIENDKEAEILLYQRPGVLNTTAPFDAMRLVTEVSSARGVAEANYSAPFIFEEETDILFFGKLKSGSGPGTVDFTLYLVENG